jgi:hypothetical protein
MDHVLRMKSPKSRWRSGPLLYCIVEITSAVVVTLLHRMTHA